MNKTKKIIIVSFFGLFISSFLLSASHALASEACGNSNGKSCFPAGTKITMSDRSLKNIEDVKVGDQIVSMEEDTKREAISIVEALESPLREGYYVINNGLLRVTDEHPIYIKKNNGNEGWGSFDPKKTEDDSSLKNVLSLELGDSIYTDNGWVRLSEKRYVNELIRTYNLKTVKPYSTFLADGVLVHNKGEGFVFDLDINFDFPCTGILPANSRHCDASHTYPLFSPNYSSITIVNACAADRTCDAICNAGYIRSGNSCVRPSCQGADIAGSEVCAGDDQNLTANVDKTLGASCTYPANTTKCEYVCRSGYAFINGACLKRAPEDPFITGPIEGFKDAKYDFSVVATDPDNDQVAYGIDWNSDSVVDEIVPGTQISPECTYYTLNELWNLSDRHCLIFANSGVPQPISRKWDITGGKVFKAVAKDEDGIDSSNWALHTINISEPTQNPTLTLPSSSNGQAVSGKTYCQLPTDRTQLCSSGTATGIKLETENGITKWTWTCAGVNGGDDDTDGEAIKDCSWTEVNP